MEVAGFVVALVALLISIALAAHTLAVGPKLKVDTAVRHRSDGTAWHVTGVQVTIYNLGGSPMPVEGVGVGDADQRSLSWAHPDQVEMAAGVRNPLFPLSLAPGDAANVLLIQSLEPGKFIRVRYFKRTWGVGPLRGAVWEKPVTAKMRLGPRSDS